MHLHGAVNEKTINCFSSYAERPSYKIIKPFIISRTIEDIIKDSYAALRLFSYI